MVGSEPFPLPQFFTVREPDKMNGEEKPSEVTVASYPLPTSILTVRRAPRTRELRRIRKGNDVTEFPDCRLGSVVTRGRPRKAGP
ncbi:MAG: hypothetical protein Kow00109_05970 [Acidobacteriota bacterium]